MELEHHDAGLERFLSAQEESYEIALQEIKNGLSRATGCGISFRNYVSWVEAIWLDIMGLTISQRQSFT